MTSFRVCKRKVVDKSGFPTKAAAYKAGIDYLHGNIEITNESISLKNFRTNWLKNVVAVNVKSSSMQTYQNSGLSWADIDFDTKKMILQCRIRYIGKLKQPLYSG